MLKKVYLEITNVCNLNCSFCHKTERKQKFMTEEEMAAVKALNRGTRFYNPPADMEE